MTTVSIVEEGLNINDLRLISIAVTPDTNLFKKDSDLLPLFNGWSSCTGDTLLHSESRFLRPRPREDEKDLEFIKRLQAYAAKVNDLNQWYITLRSRDEAEDAIILAQMEALNALSHNRFEHICNRFGTFEYFPAGFTDCASNVGAIIRSFTSDPSQRGPHAIHHRDPSGVQTLQPLGEEFPEELNGFGITIQTWDYATVRVAYFDGIFYFYESMFSESKNESMDDFNINDFQNPLFLEDWTRLRSQR